MKQTFDFQAGTWAPCANIFTKGDEELEEQGFSYPSDLTITDIWETVEIEVFYWEDSDDDPNARPPHGYTAFVRVSLGHRFHDYLCRDYSQVVERLSTLAPIVTASLSKQKYEDKEARREEGLT